MSPLKLNRIALLIASTAACLALGGTSAVDSLAAPTPTINSGLGHSTRRSLPENPSAPTLAPQGNGRRILIVGDSLTWAALAPKPIVKPDGKCTVTDTPMNPSNFRLH